MNRLTQVRSWPGRLLNTLRCRRGAIDLPSIMIGVAVVAILSVGVTATVFGAIPWAQNHSAKQGVAAVRTAEGLAANSHGSFLDTEALKKAGYLEKAEGLGIVTNGRAGDKGCFVAVMQSKSGKMYYGSDAMAEPAELKAGTKDPCVLGTKLQDAIDEAGGKIIAGKDTYTVSKSGGSDVRTAEDVPVEFDVSHRSVPGLTGKSITEVSTGTHHTCVIADNEPWCWGNRGSARLGDGSEEHSVLATPVKVKTNNLPAGARVHSISGTYATTCVIAAEELYCWGNNYNGQTDVTSGGANVRQPTLVPGLAGKKVTDASSGNWNTCAVSGGELWCGGDNRLGVNANGTVTGTQGYAKVGGALAKKNVTAVELSNDNGCAVADKSLYCWGSGNYGQLTSASGTSYVPVKIPGLPKGEIREVSIGYAHICAVVDTNLWCWGKNLSGEVGNGTTAVVAKPYRVKGALQGKSVDSVDAGHEYTCAIASGQAYCWGANKFGQTGTGTTAATTVPVMVPLEAGQLPTAISAGRYNTVLSTVQR